MDAQRRFLWISFICLLFLTGSSLAAQDVPLPITVDNLERLTQTRLLGSGTMQGAVWSPDGTAVAVGSARGIWLYQPDDLTTPRGRIAPDTLCRVIGYSPDGSTLVYASNNSLVLWDTTHESIRASLDAGETINWRVGSSTLIGFGTALSLYDLQTGTLRAQIQPDENEVFRGYDLSPDESLLVTHSAYSISGASVQDGVIRFWDMASGQRQNDLGELPASNAYGDAVRFSPDGRGVAYISAAQPYSIVLWDISTHQNRLVIQPQGFYGLSLVGFAENGTLLVTIGSSPAVTETQIYVWDTTTGTLQASIPSSSLSLSIAGNTLILWDEQQRLTLWDVRTGHERAVYGSRQQHIANADFSPDGLHLLVTGRDQMLQLWALSSPPTAQAFSRHWEPLLEIESISDPDILIHDYQNILHRYRLDMENGTRDLTALSAPFASHEGEDVVVLNPLTDVELGRLPIAGYYATEVLSADGTLLATANALNGSSTQAQQGEIVLWEVASGTQRCVLAGSTRQGVPYLRFQQNGTLLVSGGADGTVQFWDASTCQSRATLYLQSGYLLALAFSPDERLVYTASSSGRIVEWNVQSGLGTLLRDDGYTQTLLTNEILMSSDGSLLILRNDSGRSVRFMNTSGAVLGVLPGEIFRMQLSVDGATLVTSDFNGLLHVWRIRP